MCADLDAMVGAFRDRPPDGRQRFLWLDATLSTVMAIAAGVHGTGEREVPGFDLGLSEDDAFRLAFVRGLVARGLTGRESGTVSKGGEDVVR